MRLSTSILTCVSVIFIMCVIQLVRMYDLGDGSRAEIKLNTRSSSIKEINEVFIDDNADDDLNNVFTDNLCSGEFHSSLDEFITVNQRLSISNSSSNRTQCECGCPYSHVRSCPKLYNTQDIIKSSNVCMTKEIKNYLYLKLQQRKHEAQKECQIDSKHTTSGGWCLHKLGKGRQQRNITNPHTNRNISIPKSHIAAPKLVTGPLIKFVTKEQKNSNQSDNNKNGGFLSISDFGAGIGQYGICLETASFPFPLIYRGYDGAGDVEDYTYGYLRFFDLTIPLNLPVTDWVMSLEVGEHVPSQMEGMMIRNLHSHNCKGIVLSWGIEGQGGSFHINLHNNDYIIQVFTELGYVYDEVETHKFRDGFRNDRDKGKWFKKSLMVLRRENPVC